jgi:hypothetical protein
VKLVRRLLPPAALALLAACEKSERPYELFRSVAGASRLEVILPADLASPRLERLARETARRGEFEAVVCEGAGLDPLAARLWIADSNTEALERFFAAQGVSFDPSTNAVQWGGGSYSGPREALQLTAADPERPGWPVTVVLASSAATAADFVSELAPAWKPGFRAWREGRIEREGLFGPAGEMVESSASGELARIASWPTASVPGPGADIVVHGALDRAALAAYLERLDRGRAALRELIGEPRERLRLDLWPNLESLRAATGSNALSCTFPGDASVHAAVVSDELHDGGFAFARALARISAAPPADEWMADAVAAAVVDHWAPGTTLSAWRGELVLHGETPDWTEVLNPPRRATPHEIGAWRAILVLELLAAGRADVVQRQWREGWSATSVDLSMVDASLARAKERVQSRDGRNERREKRRERARTPQFRAGMHLLERADPDGRACDGYGSSASFEALAAVKERGARFVVLAPVYTRTERTTWWPRTERPAPFDSSTSDDALLATAWRARKLGLRVVLAPQLLDGPASTLADATMALSGERVDAYFEDLRALLVHVCALATLADVELVSLGSDLAQATRHRTFESEGNWMPPEYLTHATERWRDLIAELRLRYDGALTYAAGSGDEWRHIGFWSELDFVALDFYRPMSPNVEAQVPPTLADATSYYLGNLRSLQAIAREAGRPLLVWEVGFAPTERAWQEPRIAPGSFAPTEQRLLFEAFGSALATLRRQGNAPAGAFAYCWTIGENASPLSFSLQGRPAAALFPAIYGVK